MKIFSGFCIACLNFYQWAFSPLFLSLGVHCRFIPTCSHYSVNAVEMHGPFKGIVLSVWRVLRCHPFCKGGHDPVPMNCFSGRV